MGFTKPKWHHHPAVRTGSQLSLGERAADRVKNGMGSWAFLFWQTIFIVVWAVGNGILLSRPFDAYPFILLNLAFSVQAAYASPIILLAQRRGDQQSSEQSLHDHLVSSETNQLIKQLVENQKVVMDHLGLEQKGLPEVPSTQGQ